MSSTVAGEPHTSELSRAARGGALTFVGAVTSAAFGFGFSLLLARLLGAGDAGVVLQAVAVAAIGASFARLGTDTTAVWLLPRLRRTDPDAVLPAVRVLLASAALGTGIVLLLWFAVLRRVWPDGDGGRSVVEAVDLVALCLPAGVLMAVALACTRAYGRIVAFNVVDNLTVPTLRPVLLVVVHLAGGGAAAAALAWALPWWVGAAIAGGVLTGCLRPARGGAPLDRNTRRELRGTIGAYAGPRALAQALEQSIIWLDVLLVGMIAGSVAAGVYGSAARFVAAGVVIATAMRIVVAPRFSALLAQGRTDEVGDLYRVTARWILLFGAPVYLALASFAPTVLGWLGEGFASGHAAMVVLCLGSVVLLAAGNVQSLLLMAGGSAAGAGIKLVVLALNCVGNVLLVPEFGITAAAWVWAASMLLDTVLASIWVRRLTGVALDWSGVLRLGTGVVVAVGGPLWACAALLGQGEGPLLLGIAAGAVGMVLLCVVERRTLRLDELRSTLRR
ncbi:polysaccharide biosynthesis C-terminal domain-containing protein [Nocardioides yefusunii]|uniref:Polysaccharide biosynthesis C-terminal domain-containing protein n=1 Tax=Nocardioides yefusunii TaxID=2500546 RepID=A0ABW1QV19_9ACTN|nr:polysaccharide biosynthesis C-terminal domain-containing protein [Nocardioides yefusunii]